MIKLVKFNLLVDGQRCRSVKDLRENFNLVDILEHFKSGKLEKWLKVRKYVEFDDVKAINKSLEILSIARTLCDIFKIEATDKDINEEVVVFEYSNLTYEEKDNDESINELFSKYCNANSMNQLARIVLDVSIEDLNSDGFELVPKGIKIIPIHYDFRGSGYHYSRLRAFTIQDGNFSYTHKKEPGSKSFFDIKYPHIFNGLNISVESAVTLKDITIKLTCLIEKNLDFKFKGDEFSNIDLDELNLQGIAVSPFFKAISELGLYK